MSMTNTLMFLRGDEAPTLSDFKVGERVQTHPATSLWMRGARWGTVVSVGRKLVRVNVDALGKEVNIHPTNLIKEFQNG